MTPIQQTAKQYQDRGLTVIPVDANKQPLLKTWYEGLAVPIEYFKNAFGIGWVMGDRFTGLDFDLKYDITGDLYDRVKMSLPISLLKKMYVQKTKNNGFHWVFETPVSEGNKKLANRAATDEEKLDTLNRTLEEGKDLDTALKAALNDKVRVLIETRSKNGYLLVPPTSGYEYVYGKTKSLIVEEYELLIDTLRSFNEYTRPHKNYVKTNIERKAGDNNPFFNFNKEADGLSILIDNGWKEVEVQGKDVRLKRPGSSHSSSSALYDTETKKLYVFSTSTVFQPEDAYKPVDIFIELECNGDTHEAYKKLRKLGY